MNNLFEVKLNPCVCARDYRQINAFSLCVCVFVCVCACVCVCVCVCAIFVLLSVVVVVVVVWCVGFVVFFLCCFSFSVLHFPPPAVWLFLTSIVQTNALVTARMSRHKKKKSSKNLREKQR